MTLGSINQRLARLDGGRKRGTLTVRDVKTLTDDQLDDLVAQQLDARGIIDYAAYWAMPRNERLDWLEAHQADLERHPAGRARPRGSAGGMDRGWPCGRTTRRATTAT